MLTNRWAISLAALMLCALLPSGVHAQLFGDTPIQEQSKRHAVKFDQKFKPRQIIVSFTDRRLYFVVEAGKAISYPIAIPREKSRWSGIETVSLKKINPPWTPTPEMMRENPKLPAYVPGGHPMNPLGVRALYLGNTAYRIHGTDAPWTIGSNVSKGCVRMFNEDVTELYDMVPVGTKVVVTWQSFAKTAALDEPALAAEPQPSFSVLDILNGNR